MSAALRGWPDPWQHRGGPRYEVGRMEAGARVEVVPLVAFPGRQVFPGQPVGGEEGKKDGGLQSSAETSATGRDTCRK